MNCLSHAWRYLEDPWFAAGTCIPDWLGMVDRKVRVRRATISTLLDNDSLQGPAAAVARGIQQHLDDDDLFHGSTVFTQTSMQVSRLMSDSIACDNGHRPAFIGHVLVELLLDASIEIDRPGTLDAYYSTISRIPGHQLETIVNSMASRPTNKLGSFIRRYVASRFLFDYLNDQRLLLRINGVLHRVGLDPLPPSVIPLISQSREIVMDRRQELLESVTGAG